MIQFCIMSGHEGRLRAEKKFYFTLMGGLELIRPTLAKQVLTQRQSDKDARNGKPAAQSHFFLTIMGGAEIYLPTLAEEFIDMRETLRTGVLSVEEWDRCVAALGRTDFGISSFTLMGGFSESMLPEEEKEIDSLALHRHLGTIPETAGRVLEFGIGQRDAERWATIRRAVLAT